MVILPIFLATLVLQATPVLIPQVGGPQKQVVFSADDRFLAGADGSLWDIDSERRVGFWPIEPHGVAMSADGKKVVLCGYAESRIWDRSNNQMVGHLMKGGLRQTCDAARFLSDDKIVLTNHLGDVSFFDTNGWKHRSSWNLPYKDNIDALSVLPGEKQALVIWHKDADWRAQKHRKYVGVSPLDAFKLDNPLELAGITWDHTSVSDDARYGVVSGSDRTALIELAGNRLVRLDLEGRGVISPNGKVYATLPTYRLLRLRDTETGKVIAEVPLSGYDAIALRFDHSGQKLAILYYDTASRADIVDVNSARIVRRIGAVKQSASALSFSDDGRRLVVTSRTEGMVRLWDVEQARLERALRISDFVAPGEHSNLTRAELTRSGKHLVVGRSEDLVVLQLDPPRLVQRIPAKQKYHSPIFALDREAERIAVSTTSKEVELRELQSGATLATFTTAYASDMAFVPSLKQLVLSHGDKDDAIITERFNTETFATLPVIRWPRKPGQQIASGPRMQVGIDSHIAVIPGVVVSSFLDLQTQKRVDAGTPLSSSVGAIMAQTVARDGTSVLSVHVDGAGLLRHMSSPNSEKNLGRLISTRPTDVAMSPSNPNLVAVAGEIVTLTNISKKTSWMLAAAGDDWGIFAEDGTFDASPGGVALVSLVAGEDIFSVDQFAVRKNRPDLLLKSLDIGDKEVVAFYERAVQRRLKKFSAGEATAPLPTAKIISLNAEASNAKLVANCAVDGAEAKLRHQVYINGVPLLTDKAIAPSGTDTTHSLGLQPGRNRIEWSCFSTDGAESVRVMREVNAEIQSKPDLYFLAFGVSDYARADLKLKYAAKDARDLEATFKGMRASFAEVRTKVIVDGAVSAASITAAKSFVSKAKENDVFVLFIAGHGMHDNSADPTYFYLTAKSDPAALAKTAVPFEAIESLLQGIKPRQKLFLMDTCESGELEESPAPTAASTSLRARNARGLRKLTHTSPRTYLLNRDRFLFNDLSRRSGAVVFSSSRGGEYSFETEELKNGVFTSSIVQALRTKSVDGDGNSKISVRELQRYVSRQVAAKTAEQQHPVIDRDNLYSVIEFPIVP